MRNYVTFRSSAFNTTGNGDGQVYGRELADWFADRLSQLGWEVEDVITEEPLGLFVTFNKDADEFDLGLSCLNPERGVWLAWLEQPVGFLSRLFGRSRAISESGPGAIATILEDAPEIECIRWHTREQFVRGEIEEPDPLPAPPASHPGYLS